MPCFVGQTLLSLLGSGAEMPRYPLGRSDYISVAFPEIFLHVDPPHSHGGFLLRNCPALITAIAKFVSHCESGNGGGRGAAIATSSSAADLGAAAHDGQRTTTVISLSRRRSQSSNRISDACFVEPGHNDSGDCGRELSPLPPLSPMRPASSLGGHADASDSGGKTAGRTALVAAKSPPKIAVQSRSAQSSAAATLSKVAMGCLFDNERPVGRGGGGEVVVTVEGVEIADEAVNEAADEDASEAAATVKSLNATLTRADKMNHETKKYRPQEVLAFLKQACEKAAAGEAAENDLVALSWRLGRAYVKSSGEPSVGADDKLAMCTEGLEVLRGALKTKAGAVDFRCHMWAGIALSAYAECKGTKASLESSVEVKEHWITAAKLSSKEAKKGGDSGEVEVDDGNTEGTSKEGNPDPTVSNLLGRWCFTFADMGWATRRIASAVFAVVPSSSYDEALEHFSRAELASPGFYKNNRMMMGKCYLRKRDYAEAKKWLEKAMEMEQVDSEAVKDHKECEQLLSQC